MIFRVTYFTVNIQPLNFRCRLNGSISAMNWYVSLPSSNYWEKNPD